MAHDKRLLIRVLRNRELAEVYNPFRQPQKPTDGDKKKKKKRKPNGSSHS